MASTGPGLRDRGGRVVGRHPVLAALTAIALAAGCAAALLGGRRLVVNTSGSVRPGLYVRVGGPVRVGCLVDFRVPRGPAADYVRARTGLDPAACFILKPVAAGPGDLVDATGPRVLVNGRPVGPTPPTTDGRGLPVPAWRGRRVLGPDEWFVLSDRIANSFDSRCFGPILGRDVDAVRRALLLW